MTQDASDRTAMSGIAAHDPLVGPLMHLMHDLATVVESLGDTQYTQNPVGVIRSSIGGHVRHCLDHVAALVAALRTGSLDYDHRERGTPIETDRWAARAAIGSLIEKVRMSAPLDPDRPIAVPVLVCADADPVTVYSSFGRETAYVISHTIHHAALIGAMVDTLGGRLPERFGYAPSTVVYQRQGR